METQDQVLSYTVASMKAVRQHRDADHQHIARYIRPELADFFQDKNTNKRPAIEVLWDQTAIEACDLWSRGVNSMTHNPATDWFQQKDKSKEVNEDAGASAWYAMVNEDLKKEARSSGLYFALLLRLMDVGAFGFGAVYSYEDEENQGHLAFEYVSAPECYYTLTRKGLCKSFLRPLNLTAQQIIERGIDITKCDQSVRDAKERNDQIAKFLIWHYVAKASDLPFEVKTQHDYVGIYYEGAKSKTVGEHGFHDMPYHVLPWLPTPQHPYATGIGYKTLPEIRNVNAYRKKYDRILDKESDSPILRANQDEGSEQSAPQAGEQIYNGMTGDGKRLYDPLYKDNHGSRSLAAEVKDSQEKILQAFQTNLMLMIANGGKMTAHEVASRDEKIIQSMGPYIIIMFNDLENIVDRIFNARLRAGAYDPLPEIFTEDTEMEVEFNGILAKAHKKLTSANVTMYISEALATVGQADPEAVKAVIDGEEALRVMGEARAMPHGIVRTKEQVAENRERDAKAAQQQMLMEQAPGLAKAAKDGAAAMNEMGNNDQAGISLAP